ncbi:hypothetical protein SAMN04488693_11380 [Arthrobacter subterraneus]|uniref:Uncharacterized protein n=1 Tax=Arthrobacter subterraneus TaxID=335973 RepID=A0A1G8LC89_9MICC|nr:hypothetical protein [Arthrobacter subterraneus]SDI53324.1 hypothetical protein SAMN04488693_11380 [Arthrobacter subterraneus]
MNIELIAVLVVVTVVVLVVGAVGLSRLRRRRLASGPTVLSIEDRRILAELRLTPAKWLSLTNQQRAGLREKAFRSMA